MTKTGSYQGLFSNDSQILEQLIFEYSDALVRFAYCYTGSAEAAEELAEDAFAALYCKKRCFASKEQMRAWLYKAVKSRAVDHLRLRKRQVSLEDVQELLVSRDLESALIDRERKYAIYKCLQGLPRQYREVLMLSYMEGFSVSQVAELLGKNHKQVYNLLARGKTALREKLNEEGYSYENL